MGISSQPNIADRCSFSPGDLIDGKWLVESVLGEGTFGKVFKVTDGETDYALKLLKLWEVEMSDRPNLFKRFDREYETGQIKSSYLVHSLDKGNVKGNPYMVMEYCKCGDLRNALKQSRLDLALVGSQILLGLRDLHQNGKVHRDLKPENVLLRDKTHSVLTDFGISGDRNNRLTQRGWRGVPKQIFGTLAYMPPEQMNPPSGNATVLPTTDIFSYGVMMYELIVGRLPFGRFESQSDLPYYVQNGKNGVWDRDSLIKNAIGGDWIQVIEGCLVPDYKNRFQTIDDVIAVMPDTGIREESCNEETYSKEETNGILLRVMQGEELGKVYNLDDLFSGNSSIIGIGRATDEIWNNIMIKEQESTYVSRIHCTLEKNVQNNSWIIRDGQYRVQCQIGLRLPYLYPCPLCSAMCPRDVRQLWKDSLNGTFVNSMRVTKDGVVIHPGDIISIGDVKMRVEGIR